MNRLRVELVAADVPFPLLYVEGPAEWFVEARWNAYLVIADRDTKGATVFASRRGSTHALVLAIRRTASKVGIGVDLSAGVRASLEQELGAVSAV